MHKLPRISAKELIQTLIRAGFEFKRQEGSQSFSEEQTHLHK